jgi:hypothetical protein
VDISNERGILQVLTTGAYIDVAQPIQLFPSRQTVKAANLNKKMKKLLCLCFLGYQVRESHVMNSMPYVST